MRRADQENFSHMRFSSEFYFLLLLPPIIYSGGYSLKKGKFFKYFYYINLYGLLSTILSFGITVALTRLINKLGKFY